VKAALTELKAGRRTSYSATNEMMREAKIPGRAEISNQDTQPSLLKHASALD